MSQVEEIHDLTKNDDTKQIISSRNLSRLNCKQGISGMGESENIIRIPIPLKRRPIGYDEYPNFERQYIQNNINLPTVTKPEGDKDGAVLNQDDNYHFLMSLLPYLREVPKNRKMAIRHKLQKVFVEEQDRKNGGRNINGNYPNLNNGSTPISNMYMPYSLNKPQQTPRVPPPPYPFKQDVVYNCVSSATRATASVTMTNARASTSTLLGNLLTQQRPTFPEYSVSVGLSSGHQQYYNAKANNNADNNNSSFGYNATTVDNNNANNNNNGSFGYNATTVDNNNSSFGYNATTVNNNNANNNSFGYNTTTVDNNNVNNNNNSSFGYNATTMDNNNNSFLYNATVVDNDNANFTYQSGVTGEPQTFTYLQ